MAHVQSEDIRRRITALRDVDETEARRLLATAVAAVDLEEPELWAELCEEVGELGLARSCWERAAAIQPPAVTPFLRLAEVLYDLGDLANAMNALAAARAERLSDPRLDDLEREIGGVVAGDAANAAMEPAPRESNANERPTPLATVVSDSELVRFLGRFSGREGVHARQWADGAERAGYSPVEEPLTPRVLRHHLSGDITVGMYPVRLDGTVNLFAVDLDIRKSAIERARGDVEASRRVRRQVADAGLKLRARLGELGLPALLEDSGYKGRHLWCFLAEPEDAVTVHGFGKLLVRWLESDLDEELQLEFFPKQGILKGKVLGNLIKLPLGIHRRSGKASALLDEDGRIVVNPFAAVRDLPAVRRQQLHEALGLLRLFEARGEMSMAVAPAGGAGPVADAPASESFRESDFDDNKPIAAVLAGCPVLRELRQLVEVRGRLRHDEQLVLTYTLGHLPEGPPAVNHLLAKCADIPLARHLKSRLAGNPMSCPRIRKRIPHITSVVACNCIFPETPDHYPTPLLHASHLAGVALSSEASDALEAARAAGRRLVDLERRQQALGVQMDEVVASLVRLLPQFPERAITLADGRVVRLEAGEGVAKVQLTLPGAEPSN